MPAYETTVLGVEGIGQQTYRFGQLNIYEWPSTLLYQVGLLDMVEAIYGNFAHPKLNGEQAVIEVLAGRHIPYWTEIENSLPAPVYALFPGKEAQDDQWYELRLRRSPYEFVLKTLLPGKMETLPTSFATVSSIQSLMDWKKAMGIHSDHREFRDSFVGRSAARLTPKAKAYESVYWGGYKKTS